MKEILKKLRFLDKILNNISNLSYELNKLHSLRIIKFKESINNFDKIEKIILLINSLKITIKNEIEIRLINNNSYLQRYDSIKVYNLSKNIKYFSTKITNDYKFIFDLRYKFIEIKKDIDKIIKKLSINKKKKHRIEIVDYNKYCSDYNNKNINNYVINKMNKYKSFFLIKST
jgi:hypothetical protein